MHRQRHPRRRPPTAATAAPPAFVGCAPSLRTHIEIPAQPAGGITLAWPPRVRSAGHAAQGRQMRSSYFTTYACHTAADASARGFRLGSLGVTR